MEKLYGSMETLSAMQLTANMEGLDAQSKLILHSREVLAVILQETVSEYKGYSRKEIMDFIELESISDRKEVSAGRTNTQIQGGSAEFNQLNEKISIYEIVNTKNTGTNVPKKENYDLLTLVIIKLGDAVYNGEKEDEGYELFRFLNAVMYPHKDDFLDVVSEYIDFSDNAELWEEVSGMDGLGQCVFEDGLKQGIRTMIIDNLEENVPRERIIAKLQRAFELTEEESLRYYEMFADRV